ncbi:hypothetical protein GCM10025868_15570 [Angustibacter aerolatus]|uniref:Uncharacterized protein n=1 Tax=Angustibacter aerolatus TaxID=1162965 RepID=A0ABQ6JDP4_9ACTN|nr:hypothetical protein GCM10025868_15570 [Angustibacter aerolatus]
MVSPSERHCWVRLLATKRDSLHHLALRLARLAQRPEHADRDHGDDGRDQHDEAQDDGHPAANRPQGPLLSATGPDRSPVPVAS